jgi:hypothetical protein
MPPEYIPSLLNFRYVSSYNTLNMIKRAAIKRSGGGTRLFSGKDDEERCKSICSSWLNAWNHHDLPAILSRCGTLVGDRLSSRFKPVCYRDYVLD